MTYDYACTACGHQWEAEQRISENPLKDCPSCGQITAKRLVSGGAGFILKGGGWYADGYASKGQGKSSGGGKIDGNGASQSSSNTSSSSTPSASTDAGSGSTTKTESKASSGTAAV